MAVLPIIVAPDPRLKGKSARVEKVDDGIRKLMDDMLETMKAAPGVGLAAPQVGVRKRVIVVDVTPSGEPSQPYLMADPEIVWASDETVELEEGCLSLPQEYALVERPTRVRVRYLDYENEIRELEAEGLLATCVQHEMDHLEGVLFVDRISALRRNIILRRLQKEKKAKALARA
jgi:peptide deformylase